MARIPKSFDIDYANAAHLHVVPQLSTGFHHYLRCLLRYLTTSRPPACALPTRSSAFDLSVPDFLYTAAPRRRHRPASRVRVRGANVVEMNRQAVINWSLKDSFEIPPSALMSHSREFLGTIPFTINRISNEISAANARQLFLLSGLPRMISQLPQHLHPVVRKRSIYPPTPTRPVRETAGQHLTYPIPSESGKTRRLPLRIAVTYNNVVTRFLRQNRLPVSSAVMTGS
jgi:hypothetical protein